MPSGRTHTRIDLAMLGGLLCLAAYFWAPLTEYFGRDSLVENGLLFVAAYLFGTFLLSPDMDLARSDPMQNWGLLRVIWRPYAALFKHRGLSHVPVLGTLTRVAYLLAVVYILTAAVNMLLDLGLEMSIRDLRRVDRQALIWALCGLCLPDIFHILADRLFKNAR